MNISRLPREAGSKAKGQTFRAYPIGYLHLDFCEVHTGEGRAYLFVAVDRISKFVHAQLYHKANRDQAAASLEDVVQQLPYRVHTVLTDNSAPFTKRRGTEAYKLHRFDVVCCEHGIEHRLTRPFHPWTVPESILPQHMKGLRALPLTPSIDRTFGLVRSHTVSATKAADIFWQNVESSKNQ